MKLPPTETSSMGSPGPALGRVSAFGSPFSDTKAGVSLFFSFFSLYKARARNTATGQVKSSLRTTILRRPACRTEVSGPDRGRELHHNVARTPNVTRITTEILGIGRVRTTDPSLPDIA